MKNVKIFPNNKVIKEAQEKLLRFHDELKRKYM